MEEFEESIYDRQDRIESHRTRVNVLDDKIDCLLDDIKQCDEFDTSILYNRDILELKSQYPSAMRDDILDIYRDIYYSNMNLSEKAIDIKLRPGWYKDCINLNELTSLIDGITKVLEDINLMKGLK